MEITLPAYAKINLALDVRKRRADGYHEIATVLQTVSLADLVTLTLLSSSEISVEVEGGPPEVPPGEENLAWRAAWLLKTEFGFSCGVGIKIKKRIPVAAGLGGGSADAAAVLLGLNYLLGLGLRNAELSHLGLKLGSDVPFCLQGGTALGEGRGENLTSLPPPFFWLVLVKPPLQITSAEAYSLWEQEKTLRALRLAEALKKGEDFSPWLGNALEPGVTGAYPKLGELKLQMQAAGLPLVFMAGSGPVFWGKAESFREAQAIANLLKKDYETFVARTL